MGIKRNGRGGHTGHPLILKKILMNLRTILQILGILEKRGVSIIKNRMIQKIKKNLLAYRGVHPVHPVQYDKVGNS
jgi:hypothetical protein